ncbi:MULTISPECIES: type II toxin-antitoxin system Phd/YefM family antitoxin [unclassified Moorena]|uniref:type II toxin-antitoxin system Phd/YefM family antitoxin n=1 Tax=unclassified Moorena TaxID=2683338 RepID=UPI0025EA0C18|nr:MULTISPECIES: type II toxin-antitoxin system Phd/YefM family antitoxin [unclassified Moorena]
MATLHKLIQRCSFGTGGFPHSRFASRSEVYFCPGTYLWFFREQGTGNREQGRGKKSCVADSYEKPCKCDIILVLPNSVTSFIMKTISKSILKSKLLELLQLVESEGEEIVVTDRGKPVVIISKYGNLSSTEQLFGKMRGKVKYFEDLTTPTIEEWGEVLKLFSILAL